MRSPWTISLNVVLYNTRVRDLPEMVALANFKAGVESNLLG
jgi:hypothetical protein